MSSQESYPFHPVFNPEQDTVPDIKPIVLDDHLNTAPVQKAAFENPTNKLNQVAKNIHSHIDHNIEPSLGSINIKSPEIQQKSVRKSLLKILGPAVFATILTSAYFTTRDSQSTMGDDQAVATQVSEPEMLNTNDVPQAGSEGALLIEKPVKLQPIQTPQQQPEVISDLGLPSPIEKSSVEQEQEQEQEQDQENAGFDMLRNYIEGSNISKSVAYKFFSDKSFQNILRNLVLGGLNPKEQDKLYDLLEEARIIPGNTRGRIAAMQDPLQRAMDYVARQNKALEQNEDARAKRMQRRTLTMCLRAIQMQKSAYEIAEILRLTADMDVNLVAADNDYMPLMDFLQTKLKEFDLKIDPKQFLQTRVPNRTNFFQEIADSYDKYNDILPITDIISKEVFVAIFVHELAPRLKNVTGNSFLFASLIMTYISDLQPFNAFRPSGGALRIGGTQIGDDTLNWLEFDENIRKELIELGKQSGVSVDGFQSAFLLANINFDALFLLGYGALATNHRYSGGRVANIIGSNRVGGPASRRLSSMAKAYTESVLEFVSALKTRWKNVFKSSTE